MSVLSNHINELKAAQAFTKQAPVFDDIYGRNAIIQYKRQRVRTHMLQYLKEGDVLLELNCGTGEDALFFAGRGHAVHATDISAGMLLATKEKTRMNGLEHRITTELCSFTELDLLQNQGPFDYVYSNFGGLNCTGELEKVCASLATIIKPGGAVTLVIISRFCLWETLLLFKGKFKTAFRRFFSGKGRKAKVEDNVFTCWYYNPSSVIQKMKNDFEVLGVEGLCTLVPPSYIEHFAEKYPRWFSFLCAKEERLKGKWPWRSIGDYFMITFRKK